MLAACAPQSAPIIDKSPHRVIPLERTVRAGDSLYSIAWEFGLNYLQVAKWNQITNPYVIRPGQKIRLHPPATTSSTANNTSSKAQPTIKATQKPAQPASAIPKPAKTVALSSPTKWQWPAKGKLVTEFSRSKGRNGIEISGQSGSPVTATAKGQVVYAGQGLRGYGKLIIVKHSDKFLSAYAHNQSILVKEGQVVNSGQQIGKMGNTGTNQTMLHFEIRQDGKPVDPLKFLR